MTVKAIETWYAGCRFRSRLEARYAVLFDRIGIQWQYEPQGYVVGGGWGGFPETPYLPDFWLPQEKLWVEVKGAEADLDHALMLHAAIPHWGLPSTGAPYELRMLILGPLPRPGSRIVHSVLRFHEGDVSRAWCEFGLGGLTETGLPDDEFGNDHGQLRKPERGLTMFGYLPGTPGEFISDAYTAARSARFEHGQSGA